MTFAQTLNAVVRSICGFPKRLTLCLDHMTPHAAAPGTVFEFEKN